MKDVEKYFSTFRKSCLRYNKYLKKIKEIAVPWQEYDLSLKIDFPQFQ